MGRPFAIVGLLSFGVLSFAAAPAWSQARTPARPGPTAPAPTAPAESPSMEAAPPDEPGYTTVRLPGGGYYRYRTDEKPDSKSNLTAADEPGTVQIVPRVTRATSNAAPGTDARTAQTPPAPGGSGPRDDSADAEADRDHGGHHHHAMKAGHPAKVAEGPCLTQRQYLARRLLQLRGLYDVPLGASIDVLATADVPLSPWVTFAIFGVGVPPTGGGNQLVNALNYDFEAQWRLEELMQCEEQAGVRTPVRGQLP